MSYIDDNISTDEKITKRAIIHWFIYVWPSIYMLIVLFASPWFSFWHFLGFLWFLSVFIVTRTTEFAVTNKKVIAKQGLISRKTVELNLSKVESLSVDQGIFGRIFNFGKVIVRGTGGVQAPFNYIADPMGLRKAVNEEYDKSHYSA